MINFNSIFMKLIHRIQSNSIDSKRILPIWNRRNSKKTQSAYAFNHTLLRTERVAPLLRFKKAEFADKKKAVCMRTTVRLLKQWTYDERNKKEEKQFRVRRHRNMFFAQTVSQTGIIQQYQSITSSPFARFITSGSQSTAYISPLAYGKSFSKNYEF